MNSTGINLKIDFVFLVWNSAVLWKPVNLLSDRHNRLDFKFQISSWYLLHRLQSQWKLSHMYSESKKLRNLSERADFGTIRNPTSANALI